MSGRIAGVLRVLSVEVMVALVALFVAPDGTTYAAVNLPANSAGPIGVAAAGPAQGARGQAAACDGFAFFRVTAMRLEVVRKGTWRAPDRTMNAVERDRALGPGRKNLHPVPYSPPAAFECQTGAFDIKDALPVRSVVSGSWQDMGPWPPGVPRSGACNDTRLFSGGASNGLNLRAPAGMRGARFTFRLGLDLDIALSCEAPDRSDNCPPEMFDCADAFRGKFDGSSGFFGADTSDRRYLPGRPGSLPAGAALRRTSLTIRFSGRYVYRGTWKSDHRPNGTERIEVTWSGSMTLRRYARCHRGVPVVRCIPSRLP